MTSTDQPDMPEQDGITASVLDEPRKYAGPEAARAAGVSLEMARDFWRALGYAATEDDAAEFTDSDITTLRLLVGYIEQGIINEHDSLQLTRLMGRTIARLTESQVGVVVERLEESGVGVTEQIAYVDQLAHRVTNDIQFILGQTWRRHMAAAINRMNPELDELRPSVTGVGFADLVGFTALSRRISETALLSLVESFEQRSADIISEHGGRVVKMLGDEVLFTAKNPEAMAQISLDLLATFCRDRNERGLHVGIAHGPVVRHLGDVFGHTVNLASRLTGLAEPDTILASSSLAEALSTRTTYRLEPQRHHNVRGIGSITAHRLTRATPTAQ